MHAGAPLFVPCQPHLRVCDVDASCTVIAGEQNSEVSLACICSKTCADPELLRCVGYCSFIRQHGRCFVCNDAMLAQAGQFEERERSDDVMFADCFVRCPLYVVLDFVVVDLGKPSTKRSPHH